MKIARLYWLGLFLLGIGLKFSTAQQAEPNPAPDARYKVDVLIVVGHPDDDIEVAAYTAKLIEEQHKTVAVVYGTRGNSGGNAAGPEQANALADIREMEARKSLASYGITSAWFLHGSDSPGGDVLRSLELWGHGQSLEEVVRLVRITRPEVILTWLPNYVVGENHEDHQAAGVLATEAFDLAANPLAFPEQVEAARNRMSIGNLRRGPSHLAAEKDLLLLGLNAFRFPEGQRTRVQDERCVSLAQDPLFTHRGRSVGALQNSK